MKLLFALLVLITTSLFSTGQTGKIMPGKYQEDFDFFWQSFNDTYPYFDKKQTDWQKVKEIYRQAVAGITDRSEFVTLLEKALYEIYDHHAILNTNTVNSYRLVPSGTDTWAEYVNGKPIIIEVRKGFGSESSGIIAGMEVIAVNDVPTEQAILPILPKSLRLIDTEAKNFALRLLLAGTHNKKRKFTLKYNGKIDNYYPDKDSMLLEHIQHATNIESRLFGQIGYIKINDCLYDDKLIPEFDSVMQTMRTTTALILDLRETPSGGNTKVARAIIGWFITKDHFYQKHEYYAEEKDLGIKRSWQEIVSPRKGKYYSKPLVVLCNHWTGSLGEAIVIGFDALKRPGTNIIGTPMARLYGAVYSYEMPNTKIGFTFPAERLYHINGLPREKYIPGITIDPTAQASQKHSDIFLSRAFIHLKNK